MKGSITASCGHVLADHENTVSVVYSDQTCDAIDGFSPCLVFAEFCPKCAEEWKAKGWRFDTVKDAEKWLDAQPRTEPAVNGQ
jgi:hypothetical protein